MKRLTLLEKIFAGVLGLLLILGGVAWWKTRPPTLAARKQVVDAITTTDLVDQSIYATALRISQLVSTPEGQTLAQSALRIADHELDLAFTQALSDAEAHPPSLSSDALAIQARVAKSQSSLTADQQRVNELTATVAQAKPAQKDAAQDQLDLAQSQLELDKDELDQANQDLVDAGGNPRQQIESMMQEHDAQSKVPALSTAAKAAPAEVGGGSVAKIRGWNQVRLKLQEIEEARAAAREKVEALRERRAALASRLETAKSGVSNPTPAQLQQTKTIAADQKILTLMDKRISDLHKLSHVYNQWGVLVGLDLRTLGHGILLDALIVIGVLIILLFLDGWLQHLLDSPKLDRRQVETLRSITRVSLRLVALLIVLLIVVGLPSQFATTIGIVGAGLTVALKDFIVAFFGWLVLMGRNGIRIGDWVEIKGVSGEVTELGMFHTVMLETGNWSDSGHPTGRRVTFTNSFAIEGHYFNFSTSGQWLWDQLQIVVPSGRDPYPIVEAITKEVVEVTAESAHQAESEWHRAVPAQRSKVFSGTPGINVKPVVGGVEIAIRYITRANERYQLRAKLYQAAVDLLGEKRAGPG
ncbi:MAG TPA: mechanosensitive ion channel domain-containing protein [Steroidobacteraceae bacterium]